MKEVKIYTARDGMEAHFLRGLLESEGITATVQGEALAAARGDLPLTQETLPSVWVMEDDAMQAYKVAEQMLQKGTDEPVGNPWTCPGCGETIEPQFDRCWNCGKQRPL